MCLMRKCLCTQNNLCNYETIAAHFSYPPPLETPFSFLALWVCMSANRITHYLSFCVWLVYLSLRFIHDVTQAKQYCIILRTMHCLPTKHQWYLGSFYLWVTGNNLNDLFHFLTSILFNKHAGMEFAGSNSYSIRNIFKNHKPSLSITAPIHIPTINA